MSEETDALLNPNPSLRATAPATPNPTISTNMAPPPTPSPSAAHDGIVKTWPRTLLRVEGAAILGATVYAYGQTGGSWWTFAGWLLLPDLGMVGYLANTRAGAALYNAVHTETPGILMLCAAWVVAQRNGTASGHQTGLGLGLGLARVALTWLAHVGMDRMFGFGLKYGTAFAHTHLGFLG